MACKDEDKVKDVVATRTEKTITSITAGGECEFTPTITETRKALVSGDILEEDDETPMICDAWDLAGQFKFTGGRFRRSMLKNQVFPVDQWFNCTNPDGNTSEFVPCTFLGSKCYVSNGTTNIDTYCISTAFDMDVVGNSELVRDEFNDFYRNVVGSVFFNRV